MPLNLDLIFLLISAAILILIVTKLVRVLIRLKILTRQNEKLRQELDIQSHSLSSFKENTFQEENRLRSMLVVISDLAKELNTELDEEKVIKFMAEKLRNLLGVEKCAILTLFTKSKNLKNIYSFGYSIDKLDSLSQNLNEDKGFVTWVYKNHKPISQYDLEHDDRLIGLSRLNPVPIFFCQPLLFGKELVGIIIIDRIHRKLSRTEILRIFSSFSNFGAIAINNARLMQVFHERSIKDGLTGLYNHTYFYRLLEDQFQFHQKENTPFSLAMLDIDDFKKLNDTCGHLSGDFILKEVSDILRNKIKDYGFAARYGGEEFTLLIIGKNKNQALSIVEDIRKTIAGRDFSFNELNLKATVSIGLSDYDPNLQKEIKLDQIIESADNFLYSAKNSGKNKICID
ncbi:MAG: sensor domain-containing diguanylate cyclase [Candidatus Omnitrophica bacterium]|nr:sensor domain-containing diguanylate cyclase [Candidatus Omnitrophota bacterium]